MDFLKHQASYCDVIKYKTFINLFEICRFFCLNKNRSVVEKHEELVENNTKQETTLGTKRNQRNAYVCQIDLFIYFVFL